MFYTERLMLRSLDSEADSNLITQWLNDPEYSTAIRLGPPMPTSGPKVKQFLEKVTDKDAQLPIFAICKRPSPEQDPTSLGPEDEYFVVNAEHKDAVDLESPWTERIKVGDPSIRRNRHLLTERTDSGYGTEVLTWAIEYSFKSLAMHRIELDVVAANSRALHVYEKLGFVREGLRRKRYWIDGQWADTVEMGLLEEEWSGDR